MPRKKSTLLDSRLEKGFTALYESMSNRFTVILGQLAADRAEEVQFHRLINNPKVTPKRLLDHCCQQANLNLRGKTLLVLNDTSTLSYKVNGRREQLGYVGNSKKIEGFDLHSALLVDAEDGGCYGVGGIRFYKGDFPSSDKEAMRAKEERKRELSNIAFAEKERYKWFDAPQQAINNYAGADHYTLIGDREADIYELMSLNIEQGWDFVYRSHYDRLVCPTVGKHRKLRQLIDHWEVAHTYDIDLRTTSKRTAHRATLDLKFGPVCIPRSRHCHTGQAQLDLWTIEVKEQQKSVVGQEKAVHWILLTSHPVETVEDALKIVQWYIWRWVIEQLFRTMKTKGLDIEHAQVESFEGLKNLATIAMIAAVKVMQLVQARDGNTIQALNAGFDQDEQRCLQALNKKLEGKTQKQKNPHPPNTLAFGAWVIARLGGWKGYQKARPPGPITFVIGLNRFYIMMEGYMLRL